MAKIYHAHLYGLREDKYQILKENTVNSTDFHEVNPQSPFYLFANSKMKRINLKS